MIKLTSEELNTLIHNYLLEEDYPLSLEAFKREVANVVALDHTLVELVQYGLEYVHLKKYGPLSKCRGVFCLSESHCCGEEEKGGGEPQSVEPGGSAKRDENKELFEKIKTIFKSSQRKSGVAEDGKGRVREKAPLPARGPGAEAPRPRTGPSRDAPLYKLGFETLRLSEHSARTSLCAWNSSKLLATAGVDGLLRVFRGRCIFSRDVGSEATALCFDGGRVACGGHRGTVLILDTETGGETRFENFGGRVNAVRLLGESVFAGSEDGKVSLDGVVHDCGLGRIFDVAVCGRSFAAATESGAVRVFSSEWASPGPEPFSDFVDLAAHGKAVNALAFHDGRLVTASDDFSVKIWGAKERSAEKVFFHEGPVLALRPGGAGKIYSSGADGALRVWGPEGQLAAFWHCAGIAAFDKKNLLVSGSVDGVVKVWDERFGEALRYQSRGGPIYTVSLSDDERLVAVCSDGECPVVLDLRRL